MENPEKLGRYEAAYRALEAEEHAQYREFAEAVKPIAGLFAAMGVEFGVRYLSVAEIIDSLDLEPSHRSALGRYVVEDWY